MRMLKVSPKRLTAVLLLAGLTLPQYASAQAGRVFRARIGGGGVFTGGGGIGLQPVVRYVPTGTVFDATATVSHDRRYVTITAGPQSSHLLRMHSLPVDLIGGGGAVAGPVPGAAAGAKMPPAARAPVLKGKYAAMAHAAALAGPQRAAVAQVVQAKQSAELQWDLAHGAQLCQYAYQKAEAETASAKAGIDRTARALLGRRDQLSAGYHKQIMGPLMPPQRAKASGCLLGLFFCDDLAHLGLSYRQKAKIKEICTAAAASYFADTDITRDEAVTMACLAEIRRDVLTEAQRVKADRPPAGSY